LASRTALLTSSNAPARNSVIGQVQQALQVFTRDMVEPDEHNRKRFVMSFQIKFARISGDESVALFESDWNANRIRLRAAMAGLNNEYFTVDCESRHSVVASFLRSRKRESNFSNRIKIGSSHG
jgi:hypothetical protein